MDVCRTRTGFRQTEFKGGAGTGGVWLNGRFVWLTGYAQRSANDGPAWAAPIPTGCTTPRSPLVRESNGNYVRWMHVAPQRADAAACDRLGIVQVCPAGDKERMVTGRQWEQRVEVMRDTSSFTATIPASSSGKRATPSCAQADDADGGIAQETPPSGRPRHGHARQRSGGHNKALTPMSERTGS